MSVILSGCRFYSASAPVANYYYLNPDKDLSATGRVAIVELDNMVDVPVKVVLNEAIELAKKFSTPESSRFVNGILDQYLKEMENSDQT